MVIVGAIKNAVELGVFEGKIEVGNKRFFLFSGFASELQVFAFGTFVAVVIFELV